jgi:hypothetical protein
MINAGSVVRDGGANAGSVVRDGRANAGSVVRDGRANAGSVVRDGRANEGSVVRDGRANEGSVVRDGLIDAYRLSINPSLGEVPFQGTSFRSVTSERSPTEYECTLAKDQKSL